VLAKTLNLEQLSGNVKAWLDAGSGQLAIVQRLYSCVEYVLGRIALRRRRYFRAADHFCKASRRVEIDTHSRRQARVQLREFFRANGNDDLLADFLRTPYAHSWRSRFLPQPFPLNVTLRGNLVPLKAFDIVTGEKGVLLLLYNDLFQAFHSVYRTESLKDFYHLVLEPSYHRAEDPGYLLFGDWPVVVQVRNPVLRPGLEALGSPFETVPLNSGDWVDPDAFRPLADQAKVYDLIYIANWSRNKRHELLFRTLAAIRRPLRVALVGFSLERRREDIEAIMKKYGVADRCEIFVRIPQSEVNRLLNLSRVNLMLSRFELANRALYEAMFANVPSVVNRDCQGLDTSVITPETGVAAKDEELADAILTVLARLNAFSPREWALDHTGCVRSTRILNDKLKEASLARGEPWTKDIATKVCNGTTPDLPYKFRDDAKRLEPTLHHLAQFLRAFGRYP